MVDHANRGKNVLYQWYLVATQGPTAVRRARAGSLLFSSMYKRTVMMVITAHLMVGFWEAARLEKREGQRLGMYLIQGFVLAFYAVDAYLFWIAFCGGAARKRISGILRAISGSPSTVRRMGIARIVFTVRVAVVLRAWLWYSPKLLAVNVRAQATFLVDFVVQVSTGYTTGPASVRAFLPYSSLLRPVYLAFRSTKLRNTLTNFVHSILLSRKVRHVPSACTRWLVLPLTLWDCCRCWPLALLSLPCPR